MRPRLTHSGFSSRSAGGGHHTNIVSVFEVGECESKHFYVMQYIQGRSLDRVLAELTRNRPQTSALLADVLKALDEPALAEEAARKAEQIRRDAPPLPDEFPESRVRTFRMLRRSQHREPTP